YDDKLPAGLSPDGALVDCLWNQPLMRQLRRRGCPAVRCGMYPNPHDNVFPAVVTDLQAVGRLASEHFAERNFRHVGFVGGQAPLSHFKPLYDAFRARAGELGAECRLLAFERFTGEDAALTADEKKRIQQRELTDWLKQVPKPIGLLAFSDGMAARICVRSLEAGFAVPREVAVLACGNDPMTCECAPVPLSGIDFGGEEEGERAVQLLQDLMAGKPPPTATVLVAPREASVRESTDVLATSDPVVARALRFMWDHLEQNLSVDDIAEHTGVTRRRLERAFRAQLDCGVNAELRRRRLDEFCHLLCTTKHSVADLAPRVGFHSGEYLHACFRQAYGKTPRQWRIEHAD
ncbi:MAG: substrate-binding domain-containing protein, partial [Verrucomicrobia bacterium]|nr:substrate-binding domain-containing protein [Verrucomicrobiota bacterium]